MLALRSPVIDETAISGHPRISSVYDSKEGGGRSPRLQCPYTSPVSQSTK